MEEKKKREGRKENLTSFDKMSPEESRAIRQKGNKASHEARRRNKEAREKKIMVRELVRDFLGMRATTQQTAALKALGYNEEDCTNMNAFIVKLYTKYMGGDIRAGELLLTIGGLTGEEVRRDSEEERKKEESKVRVEAMRSTMGKGMNVESGDENGSVIIYMPEIEKIEEDE